MDKNKMKGRKIVWLTSWAKMGRERMIKGKKVRMKMRQKKMTSTERRT